MAAALLFPVAATAELPPPVLSGEPLTAEWNALGREALPEYARDLPKWEKPVPSTGGTGSFTLRKTGGSGFATAVGIYAGNALYNGPHGEKILAGTLGTTEAAAIRPGHFENLGSFEIATAEPLNELKAVALVIRITGLPPSPGATPFELIGKLFPATLSWNGGDQKLEATVRRAISRGTGEGFPWEIYALQWDLSATADAIRSFRIEWRSYPHSCITGLRVEQSAAPLRP